MVSSFESAQARWMAKRTDSRLMHKPDHEAVTKTQPASVPHLSQQTSWYRMDWGAGGNTFPPHLTPRDPGVPWNNSKNEDKPSYEPPPDLFAGLGDQPELMHQSKIINRSLAAGGWQAGNTAANWAAELLPRSVTVLSGDKSTRELSAEEKLNPVWEPAKHQAKSFKPLPVEELSPIHGLPRHQIKKVDHVWRTTTADQSRLGICLPLLDD